MRWDDEWKWTKVSQTMWVSTIPKDFRVDTVSISIERRDTWSLYVNTRRVAEFNTWEEASSAAPMLYQLHKGN
jgi:hypothetical protein